MNRKDFLKTGLLGGIGMIGLSTFANCAENLEEQDARMPAMFIGHGSPDNALTDNDFTRSWTKKAGELPAPSAILCISAHWLTRGKTMVTAMQQPKTIHDFGGFPKEMYEIQYSAPGDEKLAKEIVGAIDFTQIELDHEWGLDHGTWSFLKHMYPKADIPVLQLSIDYGKPMSYHYDLAKQLNFLRKKGVLIIGSGNMIHNLRMAMNFMRTAPDPNIGFDWAVELNETFKKLIANRNHDSLINYKKLGKAAEMAIPTPDHYIPLLYALGLQDEKEEVAFFNDTTLGGALSMTSVLIS